MKAGREITLMPLRPPAFLRMAESRVSSTPEEPRSFPEIESRGNKFDDLIKKQVGDLHANWQDRARVERSFPLAPRLHRVASDY